MLQVPKCKFVLVVLLISGRWGGAERMKHYPLWEQQGLPAWARLRGGAPARSAGHSDIHTTLTYYTHTTSERKAGAVSKLPWSGSAETEDAASVRVREGRQLSEAVDRVSHETL